MINNINELKSKEEVLDFLKKYLEENLDLVRRKVESEEAFEKQAWAEYQAYQLGQIKVFNKVLALILTGRKSK